MRMAPRPRSLGALLADLIAKYNSQPTLQTQMVRQLQAEFASGRFKIHKSDLSGPVV